MRSFVISFLGFIVLYKMVINGVFWLNFEMKIFEEMSTSRYGPAN